MAKVTITRSNMLIQPEYANSLSGLCIWYDHATNSVVVGIGGTCRDTMLLSKKNLGEIIRELKKHYEGMAVE